MDEMQEYADSPMVRAQHFDSQAPLPSLIRAIRSHKWYCTAKRKKEEEEVNNDNDRCLGPTGASSRTRGARVIPFFEVLGYKMDSETILHKLGKNYNIYTVIFTFNIKIQYKITIGILENIKSRSLRTLCPETRHKHA